MTNTHSEVSTLSSINTKSITCWNTQTVYVKTSADDRSWFTRNYQTNVIKIHDDPLFRSGWDYWLLSVCLSNLGIHLSTWKRLASFIHWKIRQYYNAPYEEKSYWHHTEPVMECPRGHYSLEVYHLYWQAYKS